MFGVVRRSSPHRRRGGRPGSGGVRLDLVVSVTPMLRRRRGVLGLRRRSARGQGGPRGDGQPDRRRRRRGVSGSSSRASSLRMSPAGACWPRSASGRLAPTTSMEARRSMARRRHRRTPDSGEYRLMLSAIQGQGLRTGRRGPVRHRCPRLVVPVVPAGQRPADHLPQHQIPAAHAVLRQHDHGRVLARVLRALSRGPQGW